MPKKKHKTPAKLDHLFERDVIDEDDYRDFWDGYWKSRNRDRYVDEWIGEEEEEETVVVTVVPRAEAPPQRSGKPTKSLRKAKQDAKRIGGYIVRRNKNGRFSKRGKTYQAIRRRKK